MRQPTPKLAFRSKGPSQQQRLRRDGKTLIRASQETKEAQDMKKLSANLGLPTDEGLFGFKPFAEIWVGRLAMGGFISSIVVEFVTGRGTLQQVGLVTPSLPLFATILALAGGAVTVASGRTIFRGINKEMSANELVRYRQFLGIQNEAKNISESRGAGSPADKVLGKDSDETNAQSSDGKQAEAGATDGSSEAGQQQAAFGKGDLVTDRQFANEGMGYARDVEVTNGRYAMLGFLAALLVEAGTGKGILGQVIAYLKFVGLLGPDSGF